MIARWLLLDLVSPACQVGPVVPQVLVITDQSKGSNANGNATVDSLGPLPSL